MTRPVTIKPHPITSLIPALILAMAGSVSPPLTHAEEAVVIGSWCENADCDAAYRVDLVTGKRTLLSAYTQADVDAASHSPPQLSSDRSGTGWNRLAIAPSGDIYVSSYQNRVLGDYERIYKISPTDGSRRLISSLEDIKSGPIVNSVVTIAVTPTNQILVGTNYQKVFSINPVTGQRFTLSDDTITSQGPTFEYFWGMDPSGRFWGTSHTGLIQFDPNTGIRTRIKSSTEYSSLIDNTPYHLLNSTDDLFGATGGTSGGFGRLWKVNDSTSAQNPKEDITDYRNPTQGPLIESPKGIAWDGNGRIILLDDGGTASLGGIYSIDLNTGNRSLISNFLDQNLGPFIYKARLLAVGTMPAFVGNGGDGGNTGGNGSGGSSSGTEPIVSNAESADPVQTGQPFSYTVSFTNYAASVATSVKLTDTLPKKSKLVSMISSQGKCKGKTKVVCNFGTVASGANVTATFTVTRKKPGPVKNSAFITYKMLKAGSKKKKSYKLVSPSESTTVN